MENFRLDSSTRQLVNFDNVVSQLDSIGIYCFPVGIMQIVRVLISERGLWRTTYVTSRANGGYYIPPYEDFVPVANAINEFLAGGDMSCNIVSALAGIEKAIKGLKLSCDVGVSIWLDGISRYGSGVGMTPSSDDSAAQAKGFPDKAAEDTARCEKANAIVDNLKTSIEVLATLNIGLLLTVGIGFAVGAILNPPAGIIGVLATLAISLGGFAALAGAIADNRQELVCSLYNSPDTATAYDDFHAALDDLTFQIGDLEVGAATVGTMLRYMVPTDTLNMLYTVSFVPTWNVGDGVDCTECSPAEQWVMGIWSDFGTIVSDNGETLIVDSTNNSGFQYAGIQFYGLQNFSVSCSAGLTDSDAYRVWENYPADLVYSNSAPPSNVSGRLIIVAAQAGISTFTLTITKLT